MRKKGLWIMIMLFTALIMIPSLSLAESDYEEGDGWVYRDGELTITNNRGLINFLYHEEDMLADPNHQHTAGDVDRVVIGKDVTDIVIDYYIGDYNPTYTTVEDGNQTYVIDNGWVVKKTTNTLFGAANVKQNQKRSVIDDLPTYIEHIGMYVFSDCYSLTQISIPNNVVSIGESCFYYCDSLESIALPNGLTSIGVGAFAECTSLKYVDFGSNVKELGAAAFNACIHLETPPFQNMQFDTIYGNSFWGCDAFQTVEFPPTLRLVENQAFAHSSKLTSLIFNSDQLIIENGAFSACENVRKLIFTKGVPISIGKYLFGEDEKTPDGKSFITRLYDENGKVIPYPTLYYTAAHADEWAPNGETEWNGYSIQQISQEELDAILAEARGEEASIVSASNLPTEPPDPTGTSAIENPAASQLATVLEKADSICDDYFHIMMSQFSVAVTISVALIIKNRQKKNNAQKENTSANSASTDGKAGVPNETKRLPDQLKNIRSTMKKLCYWLAVILVSLFIYFILCILAGEVDLRPNDELGATEGDNITCSASVTEYVDPVTTEKYFDILVNAPNGSIVQPIANVVFVVDHVTIDSSNVVLLRLKQESFMPHIPMESDTARITPQIEVTLPTGEVVRPSLPSIFEKVPVLDIFVAEPTREVVEIPEDQQTIRIAGHTNYSSDIPVYINDEQVYVDEAGNFDYTLDLTKLDGDALSSGGYGSAANAEITVTVEARSSNCKTAYQTIFIYRIPTRSTNEEENHEDSANKGNGWIFQDGSLKITKSCGLVDFFSYDQSHINKGIRPIGEDVTCLIIGKNVTALNMFRFGAPFFPTQTIVEDENPNFAVVSGWLINTKTKTLICAADLNSFQYIERVENIPAIVQYIGQNAFYPLNNINYIHLPDSVVGIEGSAFRGCQALETIDLSSNLRSIAAHAFDYCTNLRELSCSKNLEKIEKFAFSNCFWLKNVQMYDAHIVTVEASTFETCRQIRLISLPAALEEIESRAFSNCTALETVIINSSHVVIADSAFAECENLQKIVFQQSPPQLSGSSPFGEQVKTPDGKGYISDSYVRFGEVIPYPTLYYTAAYVDEWAPNGETEWNGYPIQQISQEELDAILAEARGEEAPMVYASPVPTETRQKETPIPDQPDSNLAPARGVGTILLSAVGIAAIAIVVIAILRRLKAKK